MSATLSTIFRPFAPGRSGGSISRLFQVWARSIGRYFMYRAALKSLAELNDRELRDIGLLRCQVDAAVRGIIPRPDQPRM